MTNLRKRSRRTFLVALGLTGATAAGAAYYLRDDVTSRLLRPAYERALAPEDFESETGELSDDALDDILALSESIYPPGDDDERSELREIVAQWVQARTTLDQEFDLYRRGSQVIGEITREAGYPEPFAALSPPDRLTALRILETPQPESENGEDTPARWRLMLHHFRLRDARHVMLHLRNDLITGIFSSRLGWSLVGNSSTWPGVPGDLHAATTPPRAP